MRCVSEDIAVLEAEQFQNANKGNGEKQVFTDVITASYNVIPARHFHSKILPVPCQ